MFFYCELVKPSLDHNHDYTGT